MKKRFALLSVFLLSVLIFSVSITFSQTGLFSLTGASKPQIQQKPVGWKFLGTVEIQNGTVLDVNFLK